MNILCLQKEDIQRLRIAYTMEFLTKLFEMEQTQLYSIFRELGILSPVAYAKANSKRIKLQIIKYGIERVSGRYGVSESFIRSMYVDVSLGEVVSEDALREQILRFKSKKMVSRMYGIPVSQLPEASVKTDDRFIHFGEITVALGRKAEIYVLSLIGGEDMNKDDPQSLYDIKHPLYGRVNVKMHSSRSMLVQKSSNYDYVALVQRRDNIFIFVAMVPVEMTPIRINTLKSIPEGITVLVEEFNL